MRYLRFVPLYLSITLLSCQKDKAPALSEDLSQATPDQYVSEVTESRIYSSLHHSCHDYSFTLAEQYRATIEYRFVQGIQNNDMYFYGIEKRFVESFLSQTGAEPSWADTSNWQQFSKYYRYSLDENKSYLYNSLNDSNPIVLFDFNVTSGDTINLASHIPNYNVFVEVLSISNDNIGNLNYPVINCKLVSCLNCYLTISPDLPNPFAFEEGNLHIELNDSANVPQCIQTAGINYSRSGQDYSGQWVNYLNN